MFALAIWDKSRRRLILARDRVGIKPLYVAQTHDYWLFASEAKAILASGLIPRTLDPRSIDNLFTFSYPLPPRTMFAGVRNLEPSHYSVFENGNKKDHRYWSLRFPSEDADVRKPEEYYRDGLRELLRDVIREHLHSDVPVGAYLSGGLDSTAIVALAKEQLKAPIPTFSIGFSDPTFDERDFSKLAAEALGVPNTLVELDRAAAELYPNVLWHLELPLLYPIAIPHFCLSQAAHQVGLKVVLSGEGADELFGGYDCFRADKMRRVFSSPGLTPLRNLAYRQLYRWAGSTPGLVDYMIALHNQPASPVEAKYGTYPAWYDVWQMLLPYKKTLFSESFSEQLHSLDPEAEFEELRPSARLSSLDRSISLELKTRLPSWILLISDRASMANGVELRVPFLDDRILEFCAAIPEDLKMRGFSEKSVLREAMQGLIPDKIRRRRKRPFYTPINDWFFADPAPEYVADALSDSAIRTAGWFDPDGIDRLRRTANSAPRGSFDAVRLEWAMLAVLGVQLLDQLFVDSGPSPLSDFA
jgi:asparagine synthase (glutamine-hydrolysing)